MSAKKPQGPKTEKGDLPGGTKENSVLPIMGFFRKCKLVKIERWLDLRKRWESLTKETDLNWHEIS